MASRRRRRKSIGKVIVDVERRVRRVEKRPGAKRLKTNVVTTEKLGYRAVTTKTVAPDAITPNEADFGTTVVTDTEPTAYLKEGLTWVNPDDGSTNVYSTDLGDFVTVTDAAAVAIAQGKNKTYVQDNQPTGGSYSEGDLWIDTNDGNKLYAYTGSAWVLKQDGAISTAQSTADGKNKVNYSTSDPGSTANTAGDIWWKYASGIVIAQWTGAGGTSWTSNTIGNAVIANLDAGKITTGYLDVAGTVKITTSETASVTGGFASRIELNSTGFYAYNGTVATVSITNTGTAVFSGTVNASAGAFTGYITAGTARFGKGVQTSKNGIYIDANNYWYDDGTFKASGSATFSGAITGSSFTSTNYASGTGVAITSAATIDSINFAVSGTLAASFTAVTGGLIISSHGVTSGVATGASITMTSAGNISIASKNNTLSMAASPTFTGGSGGNTSGGTGSIRNTWAALSDPSGGDLGDVWLKYV